MKGIIICSLTLIFIALGAAFSLAVYTYDGKTTNRADLAGQNGAVLDLSMVQPFKNAPEESSAFTQTLVTWAVTSAGLLAKAESSHRAFQPAILLIIGAGVFGLASFTRRKRGN
jgi:hypothetical protein